MTPKNLHYGDLWLIQSSPSIGHEYKGARPAIIIQGKDLPHDTGVVTVMLMSSYKGKQWRGDILIQPDALTNRLRVPTLVKVQHIQSYDTARLIKKIGVMADTDMVSVQEYIRVHFAN